jgi:branched-chain amino acid transport system permease protein
MPTLLTLLWAGGLATLLGIAVGLPSLRIKGLYLAVATLTTQFLLVYVFREWDSVTGGVRGVNVPATAWSRHMPTLR